MIKNIFIPENIGSYYLFSKRIVGIDISKNEIRATLTLASGSSRTVLSLIEEKLENDNTLPYEDRIVKALKLIKTKLNKFDNVVASFPSSSVIFKDLTISFLGQKKIKMVVPFEVEPMLPFTLDQAVIDSIITKEDKKEEKTDILVAAVKKDIINKFTNMFSQADIKLNKITVDILEFYNLYKSIPSYAQNGIIVLIDIGFYNTRLALISENQLKYIRVLPKGFITIAKKLSNKLAIEANEALNQLFRFGFISSEQKYNSNSKEAINEILQDIQFTVNSYLKKNKIEDHVKKFILAGKSADIPKIDEFIKENLYIDSEVLEPRKVIHNSNIKSKIGTIPNSFIVSLATSLSLPLTQDFNLEQEEKQKEEIQILNKQLIALIVLIFLIITSFSIYSFLTVRQLKKLASEAEIEAIEELKKSFKLKDPRNLDDANKKAERELYQQETTWQQFSIENRYSFLRYLSELSKCINPKEIQLSLTAIEMKEDTIKLYGSVPDIQLKKLQNQLKCPFFKKVPRLQEYNFKADPIILTVKKAQEI